MTRRMGLERAPVFRLPHPSGRARLKRPCRGSESFVDVYPRLAPRAIFRRPCRGYNPHADVPVGLSQRKLHRKRAAGRAQRPAPTESRWIFRRLTNLRDTPLACAAGYFLLRLPGTKRSPSPTYATVDGKPVKRATPRRDGKQAKRTGHHPRGRACRRDPATTHRCP